MRWNLRLTSRVLLVFVLFAATLLASMGTLAYTSGRAALESTTATGLLSTALEKQSALEAWLQESQLDLAAIAASNDLRGHLSAVGEAHADTPAVRAAHTRIRAGLLIWVDQQHAFTELLLITAESGQVIIATNPGEEGTFKEDQPYFLQGRRGPAVQNPYYSLKLRRPAMAVSTPVRSPDGRLLAVLAGQLSLDRMQAIISRRTGLSQTDDAYLVNRANLLVTQPRFIDDPAVLQRGIRTEAVRRCLLGQSGVVSGADYRGVQVFHVYRWLSERELCLVVAIEADEAVAPANAFGWALILLGGAAMLIASGLAVWLARTITRPVLALRAGAVQFGQGALDTRLPAGRADELGDLAREFNTMASAVAAQDAALRRHAVELEQRVAQRTAALFASEAELRALFEAMSDLILVFDAGGRCRKIAPTATRASYRPAPELLGRQLHEIFPALPRLTLLEPIQRALTIHQPITVEYRLPPEAGDAWLSVVVSPLTDETVLWVARDISERKESEQALREADRRAIRAYEQLLERIATLAQAIGTARDLHSVYDTLRQFAQASAPCSGIFVSRYNPERQERTAVYAWSEGALEDVAALPPMPMSDSPHSRAVASGEIVVTDDLEAALSGVPYVDIGLERDPQVPRSSLAAPMIVLGRVIGGLEIQSGDAAAYTQEHVVAIRMAANLAAIATENVQLLERERLLRLEAQASEERFRAIFEQAAVGISQVGLTGQWLRVNQRLSAIVGYTPPELLARTFQEITHPDDLDADLASKRQVLAGERSTYAMEKRYIRKDGSLVWINLTVSLVHTPEGQPEYFISVIEDISKRKRAEAEVRRLNAELEQRVVERTAQLEQTNRELEAFSYSVSHDLRAPLRAIDGFARIVVEDYGPQLPPDAQRSLDVVRENAQRMGQLIDDLLRFSRLNRQALQKQPVAPGELAGQVLEQLRDEQAGRQVAITIGELPVCQADPALLRQVFANLLANALKFTRERARAEIAVGTQRANGDLIYFVRDNGVGFDMRYAHKLFGVFQRLHRSEEYEGTGVGLALVQRIIHRHGGRIWVDAAPDQGATFYFTLEGNQDH